MTHSSAKTQSSPKANTILDQTVRRFNDLPKGLLEPETVNCSFATAWEPRPENAGVWEEARAWGKAPDSNLWIHGPKGVGKTHMARCILMRLLMRKWGVVESSARKVAKTALLFSEGPNWQIWQDCRFWLLDDIDKAEWNNQRLEGLWELINARASAGHKTIITCNMGPGAFADLLGAQETNNNTIVSSMLDRLKPLSPLKLTGKSLRKQEGRK